MYYFSVYENNNKQVCLIKKGMCWPAFWLLPFWALAQGMYARALMLLFGWLLATIVSLLSSAAVSEEEPVFALVVQVFPYLVLSLYAGLRAQLWQAAKAIQTRHRLVAVIEARSETEALLSSWELKRENA
jgi:hypothetical protein